MILSVVVSVPSVDELVVRRNNHKGNTIVSILPGSDRTWCGGGRRALARGRWLCTLGPSLALAFGHSRTRFVRADIEGRDSSFSRLNSDHDDRVRGRLRGRMGAEERGGGDCESLDSWMVPRRCCCVGTEEGNVSRDGKATRRFAQETACNGFPAVVNITTRTIPAVDGVSRATPRVLWKALLLSKDDGCGR
ncbi:hypothetical protein BC835DRAFT_1399196 [Cytidiella melzeri]|nr:hypothetical protein BC835DRAFT_1399196 [Cytidiella melzeri]